MIRPSPICPEVRCVSWQLQEGAEPIAGQDKAQLAPLMAGMESRAISHVESHEREDFWASILRLVPAG
jgi:hypothetical protein